MSQVRKAITDEILKSQKNLNELRELFIEILSSAIFMDEDNSSGYFDISIVHNNRKGTLPFRIDVSIPKSGSVGQEVVKTIAYDLMIFLNAMKHKRKIPVFLIHDGVFYGMSHKTMVNILNYVHRKHLEIYHEQSFQYIVTFSEDEIEVPANKKDLYGEFSFDFDKHKIIELEDIPEKMLFKRDIRQ